VVWRRNGRCSYASVTKRQSLALGLSSAISEVAVRGVAKA
jgi:hypothetical protein